MGIFLYILCGIKQTHSHNKIGMTENLILLTEEFITAIANASVR